jgi:hypothetical protein
MVDPAPAEMFLDPTFSARPQGFDHPGREDPSLMAFEDLGCTRMQDISGSDGLFVSRFLLRGNPG